MVFSPTVISSQEIYIVDQPLVRAERNVHTTFSMNWCKITKEWMEGENVVSVYKQRLVGTSILVFSCIRQNGWGTGENKISRCD